MNLFLLILLSILVLAHSGKCQLDYLIRGSRVYAGVNMAMNYTSATQTCKNLGLELVSIPNKEYQDDVSIAYAALNLSANYIWTSGNNNDDQNNFKWNGVTLPLESFAYTNWATNEPNLKFNGTTFIAVHPTSKQWINRLPDLSLFVLCTTEIDVFLFDKCAKRKSFLSRMTGNF